MSRKVALLIGNSTYGLGLPPLERPDADIAALARVLTETAIGGFDEVKPLLDPTSAIARREVARFFSGRSPDDLLLLYFSGHGLRNDRGGLYLAVQDTEAELLSGTAVPAAFISEEMDNCRSRRQILILDCCYSGAFERGTKGPSANPAAAFKGNGLGRFVLTASDSTQLAWEEVETNRTGGLSVFTRHLVRGLESGEADLDGDGLISVDELYDYVYTRVVEENPRQTPGKSASKQQGEIFLARNPAGPKLRPLPSELMQALDHPLATVREGAVRELERFLRGNDAGLAKAARAAAEQARDDDSRRVAKAADEILEAAFSAGVESVPLQRPAPELQSALAANPKSDEELPSPLMPIPPVGDSPRITHVRQKKPLSRAAWRVLGLFAILLTVVLVLLVVAANDAKTKNAAAKTLLTEAQSWPLVLADNFDYAKTLAKPSFIGLNTDNGIGTTTGHISSGVLHLSLTAKRKEGSIFLFPANLATATADFYLRVDVRKRQGPDSADSGLIFRADGSKYYLFAITERAYFLGVQTDRWRELQTWEPSAAIRAGQTNSLAVLTRGSNLILFINERKVAEIYDKTLASGKVGLMVEIRGAESGTFDFDNFEFRRKPEILTSSDAITPKTEPLDTPPAGK